MPLATSQDREAALVALAIERPLAERAAFLEAVCGGDKTLRARLDALVVAREQLDQKPTTQAVGDEPTMKVDPATRPGEAVGQTLGRYKLLERIGEGGSGMVYVAEQTEPIRRRVALKVIKLGMDTREVIASVRK